MKTIKYISAIVLIGFIYFIVSCKKEDTKGISKATTPPTITITGQAQVVLAPGQQYVDSGATVKNGTLVNTINTLLNTVPGSYMVKYIAQNADGATVTAIRKIIVVELGDPSLDLSGDYIGGRGTTVGGPVTLTKIATGVYDVSDYYGEFYEIFRGYGSAYRAPGILTYKGNNKAIMPVNTPTAFGEVHIKGGTASVGTGSNGKISITYELQFSDGSGFVAPFFLNKQ